MRVVVLRHASISITGEKLMHVQARIAQSAVIVIRCVSCRWACLAT